MKKCLLMMVLLAGGCGSGIVGGTNLAAVVSLSDARATCLAFNPEAMSGSGFSTVVIVAEGIRDEHVSQAEFVAGMGEICIAENFTRRDQIDCISCFTQVAAVVWN